MAIEPERVETGGLTRSLGELRGLAQGFGAEIAAASREMRTMDADSQRLARSLGSSLKGAFDKAVFGGAKLGDVLKGLAADVLDRTLDAALRPVQNALGAGLSGLFGGLTGAIGGALGFADGGAFSAGRVRAFAKGGVVSGPTNFPMRGGLGLMGEAGPEAIMPLTRGADGRLGVAAQGGAGPNVTINITTPNIEGFQRSRGQIATQLARTVRRGLGNL